jgi:hypothetical protein
MMKKTLLLISILSLPQALWAQTWTTVGMGGGGAQYAPAISPLNSNLRFVGCDMSGWYRSADGGNTWNMLDFYQISTAVDYGFNNGVMCPMAFSPSSASTVYGFGAQQDTQLNSPNLLVSGDGGQTWNVVPGANPGPWPAWGNTGGRITQIYIDRGDANFILIGTDNGVWRSTNGGTSFSATTGSSGYVSGFMVDQSSTVGNRTCYVGTSAGVFKSTNEGITWAAANTGLPTANVLGFAGASTGTAGATKIFVVEASTNQVYTSTDASSWTLSLPSSTNTSAMVACADNDITTAYATNTGNRNIYQTVNGGTSWSLVFNDSSPVANLFDGWIDFDLSFSGWGSPVDGLGVNPTNSGQVMFSDLGETFKSDTAGVSWTEAYSNFAGSPPPSQGQSWSSRGLEVTSVFQYAFDPNNASYNYICASDIGFCWSGDSGATWHNTARRNDGSFPSAWTETFYHVAFNSTAGTIFAAVSSLHDLDHSNPIGKAGTGGVIKSTNYGGTWTTSSSGLPSAPDTSIVYDPVNLVFYTALWGQGVYKSTNNCASWTACATQPTIGTNKDVYSLKMVGSNLYCLLSAQKGFANPGGLFVSGNGGTTWSNLATNVTGGVPLYYPTEFDVNPSNPMTIFIAAQDVWGTSLANQEQGGCYRTTNGGASWTLMAMPPGHTPYGYAPSIGPSNPTTVYYGTENQGFFESTDEGNTWARVTTLPFSSIQHVTFGNNATYVGTFGGGVWKMANSSSATSTPSSTPSATPSGPTPTPTSTATRTTTSTTTTTATYSATASLTPTASPTLTPTATITLTSTHTATSTPSSTPSNTPSGPTNTPTSTSTQTVTITSTTTATSSPIASPTLTATTTATPSFTGTPTFTASKTSTFTPTATGTNSATATPTSTPTITSSPTLTLTGTLPPTHTPTSTLTITPTLTPTSTPSFTFTLTPTLTATFTSTLTATPTNSPTGTLTPHFTVSPTPTLNPTGLILLYPNPVNSPGPVQIQLTLGQAATDVNVSVFTTAFRKVNEVDYGAQPAGMVKLPLPTLDKSGIPLANGLYYLVVKIDGKRLVGKLVVLR